MTRYYIQNTAHYAFDFILWWGPDRRGYTHDLAKAGLYTEAEARSIVAIRGEEVAWAEQDVVTRTSQAVSIEALRRDNVVPSLGPRPKRQLRCKKPVAAKCNRCGRFFSLVGRPPDPEQCDDCFEGRP